MSKVFVIPDVHLKPWMFEKASEKISKDSYDHIVILGDLVDDWGQEKNIELYNETFDAAVKFMKDHPNTLYCYGNHDVSYPWDKLESGYSSYARDTVIKRLDELKNALPEGNCAFVHNIDDVLFSHAGVMMSFVIEQLGQYGRLEIQDLVYYINSMAKDQLWRDDSPLWSRAEYGGRPYPFGVMQIVGHTPVENITRYGDMIVTDTFSTYRDGTPIGDEKFIWVDTESMDVHAVD